MDRIRTLVVDDEKPARTAAGRAAAARAGHRGGRRGDATAARRSTWSGRTAADLMFLDIQMPDLDGFGVLARRSSREQLPVTVFVTAYDRYAIQAFEAHALDYLLKPFSDQRFEAALRRVCQFIRSRNGTELNSRCRADARRARPAWTRRPASSSGSC